MVLGDRVDRVRLPWISKRIAATAGEDGALWRRAVIAGACGSRRSASRARRCSLLAARRRRCSACRSGSAGDVVAARQTRSPSRTWLALREGLRGVARPTRSTIAVDGAAGRPRDAARLTASAPTSPATATSPPRALTIEHLRRASLSISIPLTVEPSSERAVRGDRPPARRLRPARLRRYGRRVLVGGSPAEAPRRPSPSTRGWLPIVIAFVLDAQLRPAHAGVPSGRPATALRQAAARCGAGSSTARC